MKTDKEELITSTPPGPPHRGGGGRRPERVRYYEVHYSPKSHCEIPSPWYRGYIKAKNSEDFKRQFNSMTRHCEDYDVTELTEKEYERRTNSPY